MEKKIKKLVKEIDVYVTTNVKNWVICMFSRYYG